MPQTTPIFFSRQAEAVYLRAVEALPRVFADPADEADLDVGPLPCSADDYHAVLVARGLEGVSKVRLGHARPKPTPSAPRAAPTTNPGTA